MMSREHLVFCFWRTIS